MQDRQLRVLVIGAHPDDCEFRTAGVAIKYRELGHIVKFVYATNGDAGHHESGGAMLAVRRAMEVEDGCAVAGILYEILDNHDGYLEVNIGLREMFIKIIRTFKPDILITHRPNDYHPDHRNTSLLVQDSAYLVTVPGICPLTPPLSYQPLILYMCDDFKKPVEFTADIIVDIGDVMDRKAAMLDCHKSQCYEWLPWNRGELHLVPESDHERLEWLKGRLAARDGKTADRFRSRLVDRYGSEAGRKVVCAEAFEISEYGRQINDAEKLLYFPF